MVTDLGVEVATGKRAAEVKIALERGWRSAEYAEKVRHAAKFILYSFEELFRFACRVRFLPFKTEPFAR